MMTAFKIICLVCFGIAILCAIGTKDERERKQGSVLTVILGALFIAAEIATRLLP